MGPAALPRRKEARGLGQHLDDVAEVCAVCCEINGLQLVYLEAKGAGAAKVKLCWTSFGAPAAVVRLTRTCFSSFAISPAITSRRCANASNAALPVWPAPVDISAKRTKQICRCSSCRHARGVRAVQKNQSCPCTALAGEGPAMPTSLNHRCMDICCPSQQTVPAALWLPVAAYSA